MQQSLSVVTLAVADPDDHAKDIVWNPGFAIGDDGAVTFGV